VHNLKAIRELNSIKKDFNMEDRRIFIACIILLIIACLLVCCAAAIGTGVYFLVSPSSVETSETEEMPVPEEIKPGPEKEVSTPSADESAPTEAPDNSESGSPDSPSATDSISGDIARQMDEIQMQVILERGLKPTENVNRGLYSSEQLRERVLEDFLEEYSPEEAQTDALSLAAFGLLEPNFDLYNFYIDLLSEQIAGFYDQKTKEMVVVQGEGFNGPERLTYAHEYTHALQDQNYDIENGLNFNDEACDANSEGCAAVQALIEGDASLSELNWFFANGTPEDQTEIMEFYNTYEMPVFDSAPEFITMDFTFPYEYGYTFVESLFSKGGWGTVDRAYQNLPQSTEQILHPERYPDDQPIPVALPDFGGLLDSSWEEIDRGTMGEWYTYLILSKGLDVNARLDEETASLAAEGWGGDAYIVYYNADTQKSVMLLLSAWDTPEDADEFAAAFRDYANGRFGQSSDETWQGDDGFHAFFQNGVYTAWVLAPDATTAERLWELSQ